ncbi:hypothetical protein MJ579_02140 [Klebsiella pneumoniae]|nr:hypothetical protein MJ579_02140 [Klebsiella pneumoniae]
MIITTADAPAAIGPYVQGVNLGAMAITSGRLPIDPLDAFLRQGTLPNRRMILTENIDHRSRPDSRGRADR